jgi:hypothetical protein
MLREWDHGIHRRSMDEFRSIGSHRIPMKGEWHHDGNFMEQSIGNGANVKEIYEPIIPFEFEGELLTFYEAGYRDGKLYDVGAMMFYEFNTKWARKNTGDLMTMVGIPYTIDPSEEQQKEYHEGWLDGRSDRIWLVDRLVNINKVV